jgi:hypothetical protein
MDGQRVKYNINGRKTKAHHTQCTAFVASLENIATGI